MMQEYDRYQLSESVGKLSHILEDNPEVDSEVWLKINHALELLEEAEKTLDSDYVNLTKKRLDTVAEKVDYLRHIKSKELISIERPHATDVVLRFNNDQAISLTQISGALMSAKEAIELLEKQ